MKLPVLDMKGKRLGELDVDDGLLVYDKGRQALQNSIVAYRAGKRAGSASTRTKAEVRGSGKKPWRQKGTGNARAGYTRSPIWRGGGVAFGPRPRSYGKKLSKKASRLAFQRAFSEQVAAGGVQIVEALTLEAPKTKLFTEVMDSFEVASTALVIVESLDRNVELASRNVAGISVTTARKVNAYDLLRCPKVIITRDAMPVLEARLASGKRGAA